MFNHHLAKKEGFNYHFGLRPSNWQILRINSVLSFGKFSKSLINLLTFDKLNKMYMATTLTILIISALIFTYLFNQSWFKKIYDRDDQVRCEYKTYSYENFEVIFMIFSSFYSYKTNHETQIRLLEFVLQLASELGLMTIIPSKNKTIVPTF